jgi:amino acid adenylation domain-containing protein
MDRRDPLSANPFAEFSREDTNQTITQRFEQQAWRYRDRPAILFAGRSLTYAELNGAANQVAHAVLGRMGKQHGPVAIFCGATSATIRACLGVLKAGKFFVPLDGRLPIARIREILATLETQVIITDRKYAKWARRWIGAAGEIIDIDALGARVSTDNPPSATSPDALAYVSFTSGSTGAPKGVMWNHRSELFGIRAKTNALRIVPQDRVSLLRANNVGAGRDMFLALLNGAALATLDLDASGLAALPRWLGEQRVSIFTCVATVFRHAVHGLKHSQKFPDIRVVHVGGESIFKTDVEAYKRHFADDCLFINRYSISETQAVSYFVVDKHTEIPGDRVPVGYPLEGNEVVIRDGDGQPCAPGEIGEMEVRSAYLAAGYWRRPELTRAKFISDPNDPTVRTFLTGDLGYCLADGCLVHVGRKDFQAKVRGHRVELTAIETLLHQVPSVKQAVVVARDEPRSGQKLVAYVVPRRIDESNVDEWRAHLKARLADYMVPSAFIILDRLPLNAGGKIDRQALPEPSKRESARALPMALPRNAIEEVLSRFWRDALQIEAPGRQDDFAELGGDSLQAAQIVARVQDLFPLDRPLVTPAQAATIEALARFIVAHEKKRGESEKIAEAFLRVESMSDTEISAALESYKNPRSHD